MRALRASNGRNKAFTLLEAMICGGLFLAILTVVTVVMVTATRWTSRLRNQQGSYQDLTVAAASISKVLAEAPEGGLTVHYPSGSPGDGDLFLACQTARDAEQVYHEDPATLEPVYQGYTIFRLHQGGIWRSFAPSPTPSTSIAPGDPAVLLSTLSPESSVVAARDVTAFWALDPHDETPTDQVFNPFRFRLEVGKGGRDMPSAPGISGEVRLVR